VAAAQEREKPEHVEHEGDHRPGFSPYQSRLINHLVADRVLAKDRQAQYDRSTTAVRPQRALAQHRPYPRDRRLRGPHSVVHAILFVGL
jgi:hypothetical protein